MSRPTTPKASMTTMSHTLPASLYTPMMQKSRIRGKSRPYGTRRSWTQRPMRGRFRMSRITLPTYMLAITPQNMSGCSRVSSGPGCTPWMRKAPSSTAMTTLGAAPEAANNAATGGAMIPLLTLGIAPTVVMAVLLGAFLIHGVQPGPLLIREHPDMFWGVIASMYVGNVILLILNLPLIGLW